MSTTTVAGSSTFTTSTTYQAVVIALITGGVIATIVIAILYRRFRYRHGLDEESIRRRAGAFGRGGVGDGKATVEMKRPNLWDAQVGKGASVGVESVGSVEEEEQGEEEKVVGKKGEVWDVEKQAGRKRYEWNPLSISLPAVFGKGSDDSTDAQPTNAAQLGSTTATNPSPAPAPSSTADAVPARSRMVRMTVLVALPDPGRPHPTPLAFKQNPSGEASELTHPADTDAGEDDGPFGYEYEYRFEDELEAGDEVDLPLLELGTADVFVAGDVEGLRPPPAVTAVTAAS